MIRLLITGKSLAIMKSRGKDRDNPGHLVQVVSVGRKGEHARKELDH